MAQAVEFARDRENTMYVLCKRCGKQIAVAGKPSGSTTMKGVQVKGNVQVSGGGIAFGPGGEVRFGAGGEIGFGPPAKSRFVCTDCGHADEYTVEELKEDS